MDFVVDFERDFVGCSEFGKDFVVLRKRTALDLATEIGMVRIAENLVPDCRTSEGCKNQQLVEGIAGFRVASFVKDLDSILDPCIPEHNPSQKMTRLHPTQVYPLCLKLECHPKAHSVAEAVEENRVC